MSVEYVCLAVAGISPVGCGSYPGRLPVLDDGVHHPCVKNERQDLEHHPAHATGRGQSSDCEKGEYYSTVYMMILLTVLLIVVVSTIL